ncbi:DUF2087 domain-containing protein [Paeniglutamicibacter psychrophenolicus]|uniref:DUF2087 domain-containing protein n=1 Tax=Paeniglutamicibacter psychrophenolicus TaxID=257454 RepID=A0ABS4WJ64_9MICC|nr:DUF2087 domain-containing protein [Paeniglutamicibacter psychrophenolicus]MBP2376247.1 hypothetical protein [Paeniglutamicibacter psychrophenolicus]
MKDPMQETAGDWRQVFGALANDETRRYYAQQVLGLDSDLRPERAAKARANLSSAGLLDGDGAVDDRLFARVLASGARKAPTEGVDRFLDTAGRIDRYPKNHEERLGLLRVVAGKVMGHGQQLTEVELTARLGEFTDDPVLLRRYLVDHGMLLRQPDGSVYRLADGSD